MKTVELTVKIESLPLKGGDSIFGKLCFLIRLGKTYQKQMIYLSAPAAREIGRLKSKQQQKWFRLAIKPGGCCGWFYDMSFEESVKAGDRIFDQHGISIVIDAESQQYIDGLQLDYTEDLMGGGFRFHNLRAIATCGCGNSFSVSEE